MSYQFMKQSRLGSHPSSIQIGSHEKIILCDMYLYSIKFYPNMKFSWWEGREYILYPVKSQMASFINLTIF